MSNYVDLPVKERTKSFLFKDEMADVHFLVGTDGVRERIPAYKMLLATASEVFHGQLYGRFDVPYIYTDEVDLSPDNAFPVLYLAKKYLLNNLVDRVSTYIIIEFSGKNIVKVLPHIHLLDGENLASVRNTIEEHAGVVLTSSEFLELSHSNICDVLRRNLNVDEIAVYKAALAWAQAECQRKDLSFEADAREVLDDALKLVRFPLMSIEDFASGPADSNVLSDQEKLEIYKCGVWPNCRGMHWFFHFTVSTRVRFYGVAFFGRKDARRTSMRSTLSLLNANSGETLATTHAKVAADASEDTYKVLFEWPVLIEPGSEYKITAVSIGPHSMYAGKGQREVTCVDGSNMVKFEFADTGLRSSAHFDVSLAGHIPTVYFSFP